MLLLTLFACKPEESGPSPKGTEDGPRRVTVLHTNDWQSHMTGFGPNSEYTPATTGDDDTVGGLARMKAYVDAVRADSDHPVVLYDGGDWMAGDIFQLLGPTEAAELQMMGEIGYDAITLGNHEFDWGPGRVGDMIDLADAAGLGVPIVASNTVPSTSDTEDDALEAHFTSGRVVPTLVQDLDNGVRIGLLGLLGNSAAQITPNASPSTFSDAEDAAAEAVATLATEGVDLVIALTHNGVTDDPTTSPDELLAAEVPDIDIIVGGHSHTPLFAPRVVGTTTIVQAGALTQYVGRLDLVEGDGGWTVESYELAELTDDIAGDMDLQARIDGFVETLDADFLPDLGYSHDTPILSVASDLLATGCTETALGNLVTDAYRAELNARIDGDPIDIAFESQGVIRDGIGMGAGGIESFQDLFRVLPLGLGSDDREGYALVDFYVNGSDLESTCEVTASISPTYGCNYFIEASGLRCTFDSTRTTFNHTVGVEVLDESGAWAEVDTRDETTLYHITVDSYVASLMSILGSLTYGAIVITPKDEDGSEVTDVYTRVTDGDPATEGTQEVKLWEALVHYAESQTDADGDGIPDLSDDYLAPAGRLVGLE
jgi:5'-nucleotidase